MQTATPVIRRAEPDSARRKQCRLAVVLCVCLAALAAQAQQPASQAGFRIKYIADGAIYLEGGSTAGLAEGQQLVVKRSGTSRLGNGEGEVQATRIIAQLEVVSVADSSAVCEVRSANGPLRVGDMAYRVGEEAQPRATRPDTSAPRHYPQIISFSAGDPLEDEARDAVPRPRLKEINRARGRIGVEYSAVSGRGDTPFSSTQVGLVLRMDMTRIAGTYWNFTGYWRGRFNTSSSGGQTVTINDLLSRTYHLGLYYNNPNSSWVAGVGRLFIPWATSQNTIDGGYLGRRLGSGITLGIFAGSTPDPTTWNYNPDRRIAGALVNFERGSFDAFRFTSTAGLAMSTILWKPERKYAFFENGIFYKRFLSVYDVMEVDGPRSILINDQLNQSSTGVTRSYLTVRIQPVSRLSLDLSHNYFRTLPTFDPRLVGTGLVDNLLFQGLSGGARLELPKRITVYSSLGRSSQTGDTKHSWNQLYGVTLGDIAKTGIRTDLRYSKFDSVFGRGEYRAASLSRHFGEILRIEVLGGFQNFFSPVSQQTNGHFVTSTMDWFLGPHFFFEGGYTLQRGNTQNYDQWFVVLGRRF